MFPINSKLTRLGSSCVSASRAYRQLPRGYSGYTRPRLGYQQLSPREEAEQDLRQWAEKSRSKANKAKETAAKNISKESADALSTGAKQASNLYQKSKQELEDTFSATKAIAHEAAEEAKKTTNKAQSTVEQVANEGASRLKKTSKKVSDYMSDAIKDSPTIQNDSTLSSLKEQGTAGMNMVSDEYAKIKERGFEEVKDLGKAFATKISNSAEDLKGSVKKEFENVKRGVTGGPNKY